MKLDYIHSTTIPTKCEWQSVVIHKSMYFSAHTRVYKVINGEFQIYSEVEGTIRHFVLNSHNIFLCTADRIYMNHGLIHIGSLKRTANAIAVNDKIIAIGVDTQLEVWRVPQTYDSTLFRRIGIFHGHSGLIRQIIIINNNRIVTLSEDNTVRVFDIYKRNSRVIISRMGRLMAMSVTYDGYGCVTEHKGSIIFFSVDQKIPNIQNEIKTIDQIDSTNLQNQLKILKVEGNIISSCGSDNLIIVMSECKEMTNNNNIISNNIISNNNTTTTIDLEVIKPKYHENKKNYFMTIFKNEQRVSCSRVDICVERIACGDNRIAMACDNFIGLFDINSTKFIFVVYLSRILAFDAWHGRVCVLGSDGQARLHINNYKRLIFEDEAAKGVPLDVILRTQKCIIVRVTGAISVFNTSDGTCFRSFTVETKNEIAENNDCSNYTHVVADEDGRMLFMATNTHIVVVDLQNSRRIEKIIIQQPIVALAYHRSILFYINITGDLVRHVIFTGEQTVLHSERPAVGLTVEADRIFLSTDTEIISYDTDFNYIGSFSVTLEGRHREEVISRNKPVEFIGYDGLNIFCAGRCNTVKVFRYNNIIENPKNHVNNKINIMPTISSVPILIAKLTASNNKDWENYKEKLGREKTTSFNRSNFIEVRKLICDSGALYLLTREGVQIYTPSRSFYNPIEFHLDFTVDFVYFSLNSGNFTAALIVSLHLSDHLLVYKVISAIDNLDSIIANLPTHYILPLLKYMLTLHSSDSRLQKPLECIRWALFHHNISFDSLDNTLKLELFESNTDYAILKSTFYMLESIVD